MLSQERECPNRNCGEQLQYYLEELPITQQFFQATCPHCSRTFQFMEQWKEVQQLPEKAIPAIPL